MLAVQSLVRERRRRARPAGGHPSAALALLCLRLHCSPHRPSSVAPLSPYTPSHIDRPAWPTPLSEPRCACAGSHARGPTRRALASKALGAGGGGGASPGLKGAPQSERRCSGDDASAAAGCRGRRDRPAATAADADPRQRARRRRALCPLCSACAQRRRGGAGGRVRLSDDSEGRPAPGAQLPRARSGPEPHCPRRTPSPRRTGTPAPHPAVRRLTRGGRPRQW